PGAIDDAAGRTHGIIAREDISGVEHAKRVAVLKKLLLRAEIDHDLAAGDEAGPVGCRGPSFPSLPERGPERGQLARGFAIALRGVVARLAVARTLEESRQRVVIPLRDRVELVVVASRAVDGKAEECLSEDLDLVGDSIHFVGA